MRERDVLMLSLFLDKQTATADPHHHQRQYGLSWGDHHGDHHTLTSDDIRVLECLGKSRANHSCHSEYLQHEARAQPHGK